MNKKILFLSVFVGVFGFVSLSHAGACDTLLTKKIKQKMKQQAEAECNDASIDTRTTLEMPNGEQNPYVYQNPDEGCDLGFKLPGLWGSGSGINGDACGMLKQVTGGMVNEVNKQTQGAVDSVLETVPGGSNTIDATGNILSGNGSLGDLNQVAGEVMNETTGTTDVNDVASDAIKIN